MEETLKNLSIQLDKIIQQQEMILSKLENKLILENTKTDFPKKVSVNL
jgi:hypothetical protein